MDLPDFDRLRFVERRVVELSLNEPVEWERQNSASGRLCFVFPHEGGAHLLWIAQALAAAGHNLVLLFPVANDLQRSLGNGTILIDPSATGRIIAQLLAEPIVPCRRPGGVGHLPAASELSYSLYEHLKFSNFDAIHFADRRGLAYFCLLTKTQKLNFQRTHISVHLVASEALCREQNFRLPSSERDLLWSHMESQCLKLADAVCGCTKFIFQWLSNRGEEFSEGRNYLLPLPAQAADSIKISCRPQLIRSLAYVGPLKQRHGIHVFCDAVKRLARRGISLETIQFFTPSVSRQQGNYVKEMFDQAGVSFQIFEGLTFDERQQAFQQGGLLAVIPSLLENIDAAALECIYTGVPFLCSTTGGIGEYISATDREGSLVEPHPQLLADRLEALIGKEVMPSRPMWSVQEAAGIWQNWQAKVLGEIKVEANNNVVVSVGATAERRASLRRAAVRAELSNPLAAMREAGHLSIPDAIADRDTSDLNGTASKESMLLVDGKILDGVQARTDRQPTGDHSIASQSPLVSVCLIHYERPELINQAIESLELQSYPNLEVILVDDGSVGAAAVDNLDRLRERFELRGWKIERQANLSPGAARNRAARLARGEYIFLMDDDNYAKPHEMEVFVQVARHTNADVITCFRDSFEGAEPPRLAEPANLRIVSLSSALPGGPFVNCFGDTNALIRRSAYFEIGGFSEHHRVGQEDFEFFCRAAVCGLVLTTIPEALYWYRQTTVRRKQFHYNSTQGLINVLNAYSKPFPPLMRDIIHLARGILDEGKLLRRELRTGTSKGKAKGRVVSKGGAKVETKEPAKVEAKESVVEAKVDLREADIKLKAPAQVQVQGKRKVESETKPKARPAGLPGNRPRDGEFRDFDRTRFLARAMAQVSHAEWMKLTHPAQLDYLRLASVASTAIDQFAAERNRSEPQISIQTRPKFWAEAFKILGLRKVKGFGRR